MYAGFVSAEGTSPTNTSRVMPPPMPPRSAMRRIPTTVKFLKWSGRRARSAPLRAFADAAMRSMVVKSPDQVNVPHVIEFRSNGPLMKSICRVLHAHARGVWLASACVMQQAAGGPFPLVKRRSCRANR